jgi:hypothetical protein
VGTVLEGKTRHPGSLQYSLGLSRIKALPTLLNDTNFFGDKKRCYGALS